MTAKLLLALLGCAACGSDEPALSAAEREMIRDGLDTVDTDGTVVDQVEVTLSGDVDPSNAPEAAAAASVLDAEARLTPSTCIDSTVQGNVVTHVLTGCTGRGGRMLSGTVVSTWTQQDACLHVGHATTDFTIGATPAIGSLAVTICRSGTTETRTRDLMFDATSRRGKAIALTGHWDVSLDTATGCATQSGTVTGEVGDRTIDREDDDLRWCETQAKRAPLEEGATVSKLLAGTLVLSSIEFQDGDDFLLVFTGDDTVTIFDRKGNALDASFSISDD